MTARTGAGPIAPEVEGPFEAGDPRTPPARRHRRHDRRARLPGCHGRRDRRARGRAAAELPSLLRRHRSGGAGRLRRRSSAGWRRRQARPPTARRTPGRWFSATLWSARSSCSPRDSSSFVSAPPSFRAPASPAGPVTGQTLARLAALLRRGRDARRLSRPSCRRAPSGGGRRRDRGARQARRRRGRGPPRSRSRRDLLPARPLSRDRRGPAGLCLLRVRIGLRRRGAVRTPKRVASAYRGEFCGLALRRWGRS